MFGRTGLCLLTLLLATAPTVLAGQRAGTAPTAKVIPNRAVDFTRSSAIPLPASGPISFPPRLPITPPGGFGFPQLARAAGLIFSGTVINIERRPARAVQALGTVAITFHIENAIRGATPGSDLTISQWIGLWSSGQRYRVGEHVLIFLYPPSKLGLTSCVGGTMGRFVIDPRWRVLLTAQQLSAFQRDPVLGGKSHLRFSDFALAVRRASEEE